MKEIKLRQIIKVDESKEKDFEKIYLEPSEEDIYI